MPKARTEKMPADTPGKSGAPAAKAASGGKPSTGGRHILIIEDERPLAHALELKMGHEGYQTTVVSTGTDGLQKALAGTYDLILLDLIIPEVDGFTILQSLHDKGVKTPVIVLSNLGQEEDRERAKKLGAAGYYVKANTPIAEILKHVKEVL